MNHGVLIKTRSDSVIFESHFAIIIQNMYSFNIFISWRGDAEFYFKAVFKLL